MKITKINPRELKVGDILEDFAEGLGTVVFIDKTAYPLGVQFKNHTQPLRYTIEGHLQIGDVRPLLYKSIE